MNTTQQMPVSIGLVQMSMQDDPDANLAHASELIRKAARLGAEIVCLPELFRSPYFCLSSTCPRDYAEKCPGRVGDALSQLAEELSITVVGGSIYEDAGSHRFNTALVYSPTGALLGEYRKTHIPHDPGFFEQNYFGSGGSNYRIFTTKVRDLTVKIGVLICYDQWFPEAARSLALLGADIIFYPTAIGTVENIPQREGSWADAWKTVQRGHAVANNLVVCPVNRVGVEGSTTFWGGSFICNAFGHVLAEGSNQESIVLATVDLAHSREVRNSWRFFAERRPDTYNLLTQSELLSEEQTATQK